MAKFRFVLYQRHAKTTDAASPLKIRVTANRQAAFIPTNFTLRGDQWDLKAQSVKKHPHAVALNRSLRQTMARIDNYYIELCTEYEILNMTAKEVAALMSRKLYKLTKPGAVESSDHSLLAVYEKCLSHKKGHTKELYEITLKKLKDYCGEEKLSVLRFNSINKEWLTSFDEWMEANNLATNTRGIHMRNLRHIFNYAIDNEITQNYPFRRFKIKTAKTRKRNIKADKLREIFAYKCEKATEQRYLDSFKLIFMLIGINVKDLCYLKAVDKKRLPNLEYIEYTRAKTKRPYSLKVEPEMLEIIKRYQGKKNLLNYMDTNQDYRNFYRHMAAHLRRLKEKFDLPELTSYYARHSWATIAAKLEIPKETIQAALGHGQNTVTDIYIDFDMAKVDAANRRVLDYVLYGKE